MQIHPGKCVATAPARANVPAAVGLGSGVTPGAAAPSFEEVGS